MARHRALPPHRRTPPSTAYVPPSTARVRPAAAADPSAPPPGPPFARGGATAPPPAYDAPTAYRPAYGDLAPSYDLGVTDATGATVVYDDPPYDDPPYDSYGDLYDDPPYDDRGLDVCELGRSRDYDVTYSGGWQLAVFAALLVLALVAAVVVLPALLS